MTGYNNENVLLMDALSAVGVENWDGYDDALELFDDYDQDDRMELFNALHDAGVEDWGGYDDALQLRDDLLEEAELDATLAEDDEKL